MKRFVSVCMILMIVSCAFTGCKSSQDIPAAETVQTNQATTAAPVSSLPAEPENDFPALPERIDDQAYSHEAVSLSFGWTEPYEDAEASDVNFGQMSFDEAYEYYQAHGPFFQIRNAEGEILDLDMLLGAKGSEKTTMEILDQIEVSGVNWDIFQVPYSAEFRFEASRDDRPAYYAAAWSDFRLQAEGEHLGDVRLTVDGACFSGRAKSYETEKPMKYRVSAQMEQRTLSVSCEEAVGFLLTREGKRLTVLSSNECEVVVTEMDMVTAQKKTIMQETLPAGTRWYVEDLLAESDKLVTGFLP